MFELRFEVADIGHAQAVKRHDFQRIAIRVFHGFDCLFDLHEVYDTQIVVEASDSHPESGWIQHVIA